MESLKRRVKPGEKYTLRLLRRPQDDLTLVGQYLEGVTESQRKKCVSQIERTARYGPARNKEKCRYLGEKIFELKIGASRIMCFWDPIDRGVILLSHGFDKGASGKTQREIERTKRYRREYLEHRD